MMTTRKININLSLKKKHRKTEDSFDEDDDRKKEKPKSKKQKDDEEFCSLVETNIVNNGNGYKSLKAPSKGISHNLPHNFQKNYRSETKRVSKPVQRLDIDHTVNKHKNYKSKTYAQYGSYRKAVKDVPEPPKRTHTEIENMPLKDIVLEAKSLWTGPCTKKELYSYFNKYYNRKATQKEVFDTIKQCIKKKQLRETIYDDMDYLLLPDEESSFSDWFG